MSEWIDYDEAVAASVAKHGDKGRTVLNLSISRGEVTARADKLARYSAGIGWASVRSQDLIGEVWRHAIQIEGKANALRVPNEYRADDGYIVSVGWQEEATGIRIKLDDLQRMLGSTVLLDSARPIERSSRKWKDSRGAKADPRWEEILIEAARHMYAKQTVGSQADLIKYIRQWLNDPDDGISDTAFKEHLGPLWRAFKEVDGG